MTTIKIKRNPTGNFQYSWFHLIISLFNRFTLETREIMDTGKTIKVEEETINTTTMEIKEATMEIKEATMEIRKATMEIRKATMEEQIDFLIFNNDQYIF